MPFLGLFSERVYKYWFSIFFINPDSEAGDAYRTVLGENLTPNDWEQIFNEATEAGLLEHLGSNIYKIHPALPWYLCQRLNDKSTEAAILELKKKLLLFYAALAENYDKELISNAESTNLMLQIEEPNFLLNLNLAEQQHDWRIAQSILTLLGEVYKRWGRKLEFKSLKQRTLKQLGKSLKEVKNKGDTAFDMWMYLRNNAANEALATHELEKAKEIYQEILDEIIV